MKRGAVLSGYVFPFTGSGFRAFLKTLMISLVPLVGAGALAISCLPNGKSRPRVILRVMVLMLRLFLPGVALFLVCNEVLCRELSLILGYALMAVTVLSLISAAVRLPMALAVAVLGGGVRDALKRGHVKKLIERAFGSYLLLLVGVLPFALLIALCGRLSDWLGFCCAAIASAWLFVYIGYGARICFERAARHPAASAPQRRARPRRVIASLLVCAMLCPVCLPACAEEMDGAAFADKLKATFSFEDGRIPILSTAWESVSGGFSRAAASVKGGYNAAMKRLGFLADVTPIISNVNDLAEAHAYNQQWVDHTLSPEQRAKARNLMILKGAEGLLPSKGVFKWLGRVMTGADLYMERIYGGWENAYDELPGQTDNDQTQTVLGVQGIYNCSASSVNLNTGDPAGALMAHFRVAGEGRTLEVCPCFENGDYVEDYRVIVSYDDSTGVYYGAQKRGTDSNSLTCEYVVHFSNDDRGILLNAEYTETVVYSGGLSRRLYRFENGRLGGVRTSRPISLDEAQERPAELHEPDNTTNGGGIPVGGH